MEQGVHVGEVDLRDVTDQVLADRPRVRGSVSDRRLHSEVTYSSRRIHSGLDPDSLVLSPLSPTVEFLIRALDVVGSLVILTCALPVMLVTGLVVKLTSRGSVLYRQDRVGKSGEVFTLYKFRTMVNDAEKHVVPVWAAKDDDRVTPVGRILRRMRLDELPQLCNILRGDMSLVGPRPERPYFVARHKALQGARLAVKPGLTGLAQIRSFYDLKPAHKVRYDYLYIQNRSLLLNAYIILQTIPVLFTRKGW
jgi:lipopolysaccharide/colanic/teichoic acid biosynthesis glycosyltransferase